MSRRVPVPTVIGVTSRLHHVLAIGMLKREAEDQPLDESKTPAQKTKPDVPAAVKTHIKGINSASLWNKNQPWNLPGTTFDIDRKTQVELYNVYQTDNSTKKKFKAYVIEKLPLTPFERSLFESDIVNFSFGRFLLSPHFLNMRLSSPKTFDLGALAVYWLLSIQRSDLANEIFEAVWTLRYSAGRDGQKTWQKELQFLQEIYEGVKSFFQRLAREQEGFEPLSDIFKFPMDYRWIDYSEYRESIAKGKPKADDPLAVQLKKAAEDQDSWHSMQKEFREFRESTWAKIQTNEQLLAKTKLAPPAEPPAEAPSCV